MTLIDLKLALKAIEEYKLCQCKSKYTTESECMAARHGMDLAKMVLHNVPTVEAKPIVHAHWEYIGESDGKKIYRCTRCKSNICGTGNYCKECGATMDEVVE